MDTNNRFKQKLLDPITIASFVPTYNAVSRITQEVKTIDQTQKTYSFTRDTEDQIVTATYPNNTSYTWTYDERNNRTSQRTVTASTDITETYIYNKADQLTSMEKRNTSNQQLLESYSYTYDNIGQMVTKTKTSVTPNEVTEYAYYVGGNLKQVTLPDDSEITFLYDAYGNRIQKATPEEVITCHYAMGSLRREIHKDDTNTTTLYTLNYYPWGFEKVVPAQGENPQVTTPYYYVYDQKGFVQAIMDSDGDILESYEYSPFGELLTTPTITQFRFLSGREECIWDPETKLYYMHARYYDPVLGRFQTQDSMRGSMGSPVSLNRYIYCQNDPASLIDPSGNSPFNTGLPPRGFEPADQQILDFMDFCTLPGGGEGGGGGEERVCLQGDACYIVYTNGQTSWVIITLPNGKTVRVDFETGDPTYILYLLGVGFSVRPCDANGNIIEGPVDEETSMFIAGIEAGFMTLLKGFCSLQDLTAIAANVSSMKDYFDEFCRITGRIRGARYSYQDGCAAVEFMKHAVIGGYIATKMQKYSAANGRKDSAEGYRDFDRFDTIIGFWVSFWAERTKMENPIGNGLTKISDSTNSLASLVDIANIVKAIAYTESGIKETSTSVNKYGIGGMMQVGISGWEFEGQSWAEGLKFTSSGKKSNGKGGFEVTNPAFLNPFNQIGIGVGLLFAKIIMHTDYKYSKGLRMPSIHNWLDAASYYYGNDPENPADPDTPYRDYIKSIILTGTSISKKWGDSGVLFYP